ncbi:efflux RND transporter permease subunit [Inmirania thermothiophila]|uniref:Multidrug efflux pump subunit AcrB n=1 Tax=Inmirania thermothiophila TaxID=1750597 RepID=A0A3N1Y1N7_9GAMM|nr:efflux RND transporter permease subunit [Inmirania thermothiophila]ROR32729.1 multidrug efflux pump subunit AcrB [Inmirania thermothiophila]
MSFRHREDLVGVFARHPVAANLLMLMMILAGAWALTRLNVQFFPTFELDLVLVRVTWPGAGAEDVEEAVTTPLERELKSVDGLKEITSTSATGVAAITLEFEEGTDMAEATERVKERVARVDTLPESAETPEVIRIARYDRIARLLVSGPLAPAELRRLVHRYERELLDRGVSRVTLHGLPDEEIAIQVPAARLQELGLGLGELAARIRALSSDLPAGIAGREDVARLLRSLDQRRSPAAFADLPVLADARGRLLRLGDIATIERRPQDGEVLLRRGGEPAVELELERAQSANTLTSARILREWLAAARPPQGIRLSVYDETWRLVRDRIMLLVKNGAGGFLLVLVVLYLFLNGRVAFWVAVGVPVAFMATLAVLHLAGGSINMVSLFGLIMTLGIIVDDAIVVGEDAMAHYQAGEDPLEAAEGGARRMLAPVLSASLTTMAAFLPLMLVGGVIGKILSAIPLVVVCALAASLLESFLVLPGHLRHSFARMHHAPPGRLRTTFDAAFTAVRERLFRPLVRAAVRHRATTLAAAVASLLLALGLVAGGRIGFTFFPQIEGTVVYANVGFVPGTPRERVAAFLAELERALREAEAALGGGLVEHVVRREGLGVFAGGAVTSEGEHQGSLLVELTEPDRRRVRNRDLVRAWRERVRRPPGLETFNITERLVGPPGRDIDVRLVGADPVRLKAAALALAERLRALPGVGAVEDDMPWGMQQLVYRLTPEGRALGLTVEELGRQLRAAYEGVEVQVFQDAGDEVEVRVILPDAERHRLASLARLGIRTPAGGFVPLEAVARLEARRGFDVLRHDGGDLAVHVTAEVDAATANPGRLRAALAREVLPEIARRHGVRWNFEGRAQEQAETLGDMRRGLVFALAMIYLVLAWVFASYLRPLVVMAIIPFGLVGAVAGHWLAGRDLTILSLFGIFGLSGIVVNDAIILVSFYRRLRAEGMRIREAVVEAACQRLRAVLLTSLTTIAGLTPLLFETSVQAQFLIPMALAISSGLAFTTVLVLVVIPALLSWTEELAARLRPAPRPAPSGT